MFSGEDQAKSRRGHKGCHFGFVVTQERYLKDIYLIFQAVSVRTMQRGPVEHAL